MLSNASELKYTKEIQRLVSEEFSNPSEDFVKFFASKVYSKKITEKVRDQFVYLTKRAMHQYINERINDRLKSAMSADSLDSRVAPAIAISSEMLAPVSGQPVENEKMKVETTADELEAFSIIKAVIGEFVDPKRLAFRDTQSYAGILLDDNNRKPICRLRFSTNNKTISIVNASREEQKIVIQDLNEIYQLRDKLRLAVESYDALAPSAIPGA